MNFLAQDYVVVAESPDKQNVFAGTPGITTLPTGELVASYEWFRPSPLKETIPHQTEVKVSADGGKTWEMRGTTDVIWPSTFYYDNALYMIGNRRQSRSVIITRSVDGGYTWEEEVDLFPVRSHNSATTITFQDGHVYRAFETCPKGGRSGWESFVVAGDLSQDMLDPAAWRITDLLPYPGTPEILTTRFYPPEAGHNTEDCWIEGNIISVHGQLRNLLRIHLRGRGIVGMVGICDLDDDGKTMDYRFTEFCPMLGGQCKFQIVYDEVSQLFWTAVTPPMDTFSPDEARLRETGFRGPPGNERRILLLIYSADAMNWFQAGCVAMTHKVIESFSYTSQVIIGDDLGILARTSVDGKNQHDTNLVTFHKVKNFRNLALDLHRDYTR